MKFVQFIYRKRDALDITIYLASLYADNIVITFISLILLSVSALRLIATLASPCALRLPASTLQHSKAAIRPAAWNSQGRLYPMIRAYPVKGVTL